MERGLKFVNFSNEGTSHYWKKYLLFFDEIVCSASEEYEGYLSSGPGMIVSEDLKQTGRDYDYLSNKGIAVPLKKYFPESSSDINAIKKYCPPHAVKRFQKAESMLFEAYPDFKLRVMQFQNLPPDVSRKMVSSTKEAEIMIAALQEFKNAQSEINAHFTLTAAIKCSENSGLDIAITIPGEERINPSSVFMDGDRKERDKDQYLCSLILNEVPLPSDKVPWDEIIDFRNDGDVRTYLRGLRLWMRKAATQDVSPRELAEELDWLLSKHKMELRAQKVAEDRSVISGLFALGADVVEDFLKLNLGSLGGRVGSFVSGSPFRLKAEISTSHPELNFFVRAQNQFGTGS